MGIPDSDERTDIELFIQHRGILLGVICLSFFINVVTALLSICIFGFNEVYIGFPLMLSEHESETTKDRGAATALNFLFASCICFFVVVHPATSTDVDERACVHNEL